ncbi:hypothetical protein STEG23_008717, partial [Scotinomys teguina]
MCEQLPSLTPPPSLSCFSQSISIDKSKENYFKVNQPREIGLRTEAHCPISPGFQLSFANEESVEM